MSSLKIFIVGAGPVATLMARSLREAGEQVLGLWARREGAAMAAAKSAGVPGFASLPPELGQAQVVLLAVSDAAIAPVAEMLVQGRHVADEVVFLHCAGAQSALETFSGLGPSVSGRGLLHPLRAITAADLRGGLRGTFFGIEGDETGRATASRLCQSLGGQPLPLRSEQMPCYHAAASVAANYVVALMDLASRLMACAGVESQLGQDALCQLAEGALANVRRCGLPQALTGPIRRGDRQTIARHLQAIEENLPGARDLYREAARWTVPMALAIGEADPAQLAEIEELIAGPDQPLK